MDKSYIKTLPAYFDHYINKVPDIDIITALHEFGHSYVEKNKDILAKIGHKTYAPGKWTVRDILQHIIDTERIFGYRALRIARNDKTALPGFDENFYAVQAKASGRKLDELLDEFGHVRESTLSLFRSFDDVMMGQESYIFKSDISVIALGYTITGHVIHHMGVMEEKYFPLALV